MKVLKIKQGLFFIVLCAVVTAGVNYAQNKIIPEIIDIKPFENSAHHWYNIWAPDNMIEPLKERPKHKPADILQIADNIILFQKNNGGWPKNYDMLAKLTEEQKQKVAGLKEVLNTTFDNWTTHSHVEYLAKVFTKTKVDKYKDACMKGIDFILAAQYPNGGWPQFYPDTSGYAKHITFNDGVMAGIMELLYGIILQKKHFSFISAPILKKVNAAFYKGIDCILKCQINDNGNLSAWGQQHDYVTLKPQWARAYEPPSICNAESAKLVIFLMKIINPSNEIINAVQNSIKWFKESEIRGIKIAVKKIKPVKYRYSTIDIDKYIVKEPNAPPIWTRYYELVTHKPLFCNRDGKVVYSFAEILHERRAGYGWYTYDPQEVLNNYPDWQKKWVPDKNALKK